MKAYKPHFLIVLVSLMMAFVFTAQSSHAQVGKQMKRKHINKLRKDTTYQRILREANVLFQQKDYEASIEKYKEALDIIPEDSYTLAKIDDLKIIVDQLTNIVIQEQEIEDLLPEVDTTELVETPAPPIEEEVDPEPVREEKTVEKEPIIEKEPLKEPVKEPVKQPVKEPVKQPVKEPVVKEKPEPGTPAYGEWLAKNYEDGLTEKTYKEGNKTITMRVLVQDGKGTEYKKVVHNWGGVYFFKDGQSITERAWKEETEPHKK